MSASTVKKLHTIQAKPAAEPTVQPTPVKWNGTVPTYDEIVDEMRAALIHEGWFNRLQPRKLRLQLDNTAKQNKQHFQFPS